MAFKLTSAQQRQIVMLIAHGFLPAEVRIFFKEQHGLELTSAHIQRHDPRVVQGRSLRKEMKALFYSEYEKHVQDLEQHSLAHRANRVGLLERVIDEAITSGDRRSVIKAVDSITKIMAPLDYAPADEDEPEDM